MGVDADVELPVVAVAVLEPPLLGRRGEELLDAPRLPQRVQGEVLVTWGGGGGDRSWRDTIPTPV